MNVIEELLLHLKYKNPLSNHEFIIEELMYLNHKTIEFVHQKCNEIHELSMINCHGESNVQQYIAHRMHEVLELSKFISTINTFHPKVQMNLTEYFDFPKKSNNFVFNNPLQDQTFTFEELRTISILIVSYLEHRQHVLEDNDIQVEKTSYIQQRKLIIHEMAQHMKQHSPLNIPQALFSRLDNENGYTPTSKDIRLLYLNTRGTKRTLRDIINALVQNQGDMVKSNVYITNSNFHKF